MNQKLTANEPQNFFLVCSKTFFPVYFWFIIGSFLVHFMLVILFKFTLLVQTSLQFQMHH